MPYSAADMRAVIKERDALRTENRKLSAWLVDAQAERDALRPEVERLARELYLTRNERDNLADNFHRLEAEAALAGAVRVKGLTLSQLQGAHIERQEEWCPDQKPDLSFRGNEMAGEVGEACNVIKKLERERQGWRGSRATKEKLAEELADVVHTAVLCAITAGIDIEPAVIDKFNATSEKNGLASRLSALEPPAPQEAEADRVRRGMEEILRQQAARDVPFAPQEASEPVAYAECIDGRIVSVRLDRSRHCTVPLYTALPAERGVTEARPTGHIEIAHDGFAGDIIGHYTTREGKRGFVVQQDGTRVVHVYGEKWLTPPALEQEGEDG